MYYIVGPNSEAPTAYYYTSYPTTGTTISQLVPELISAKDKWTHGMITDIQYINWLESQVEEG